MIIGLVVLGALLVLVLFGLTQRTFDKMRITTTIAIILILAMAVGVIVPAIPMGNTLSMSAGGFIIPVLFAIYLMVRIGLSREMIWTDVTIVAVAGVVIGFRFWIPQNTMWQRMLYSAVVGLITGGISYLVSRNRKGAYAASILGIFLGETIYFLAARFGLGWSVSLHLGSGAMFDAVMLSSIIAVLLAEVIGSIRERATGMKVANTQALQYEAGYDYSVEPRDEFEDYFKD